MPSRWTTNVIRWLGLNTSRYCSSRNAFVHRSMFLPRSSMPATTSSMPLYTSGSPPQIETTGAGHCAPASMHSSTVSLALFDSYSRIRSEEHTSELQSHSDLVCRLLLEKKKKNT